MSAPWSTSSTTTTRSRASRHRHRGARRARHRDEDVRRRAGRVRRGAERLRHAGLARPARRLPVVNETAVEYAIRIGLALNCSIAETCRFARKNYFYPDVPKNFQTSQYDEPIAYDGYVNVELEDGTVFRVDIERAHMEEDAGKNTHVGGSTGRIHGAEYSLVDYNRAGIPLVEIVTRPITGAGERAPEVARAYVQTLRDLFRALEVSEARMERGNVRADVNVSLRATPERRWVRGPRRRT